jgi:hypothetical protein
MGQLEFVKGQKLDPDLIFNTFKIASSKKISRVLEQPTKYILIFDDASFRGENVGFEIIPNRLLIENYKRVIYSNFIEFRLEYFPVLMKHIELTFPHIYNFIIDENIESIKIKPACIISSNNSEKKRIEVEMIGVAEIQEYLLEPNNAIGLDIFVLAELIREFYIGEKDKIKGFLIQKQILKYIKALLEEKVNAEYVINKVKDNPELVDNNNFFKGNNDKYYFNAFKNYFLKTTKKSNYMDTLDLKFISALDVMSKILNDKRFGRRE